MEAYDLKVTWKTFTVGSNSDNDKFLWARGMAESSSLQINKVELRPKLDCYHLVFLPKEVKDEMPVFVNNDEVGLTKVTQVPASEWGLKSADGLLSQPHVEIQLDSEWVDELARINRISLR